MFSALPEVERDAITAVVFIATFFVAVGIGRFLKGRAGVRLGLLFRLFCLILAFFAPTAICPALRLPCRSAIKRTPGRLRTCRNHRGLRCTESLCWDHRRYFH